MADSPGSPLSSLSHSLEDDEPQPQSPSTSNITTANTTTNPPSKRRRTGITTWDCHTPISSVHDGGPSSPSSTISSDTSGEVPNSPGTMALLGASQDDDYSGQGVDQVTVCRWEGCDAGDLGNMDDLVQHIRNEHVGGKHKKYLCEWADCSRKGQTHASGYALRAHMRSHTREKPFFCSLPECDRSFTRSDALSKHTRTVHEVEAIRPSDPSVPKQNTGGNPSTKLQRIKLKISQPPKDTPTITTEPEQQRQQGSVDQSSSLDTTTTTNTTGGPGPGPGAVDDLDPPEYGPEIGFDEHELSLRPFDLYRLLRRQIHWAEQESERLRAEWEGIWPKRKQAWRVKEAIFDDVMKAQTRLFNSVVESRQEKEREMEMEREKEMEMEREREREREREKEKEKEKGKEKEKEEERADSFASQGIIENHGTDNDNHDNNAVVVNGFQPDGLHQQQQPQQQQLKQEEAEEEENNQHQQPKTGDNDNGGEGTKPDADVTATSRPAAALGSSEGIPTA